jgi:hypothetical protein
MGALEGRGSWPRYNKKATVDHLLRLPAHKVVSALLAGGVSGWQWTTRRGTEERKSWIGLRLAADAPGAVFLFYRYGDEDIAPYRVRWETTIPHYGGRRYWWLCPECGRRCAALFGGRLFLCRQCHNLTYRSAQRGRDPVDRIVDRLAYLWHRLGGRGHFQNRPPDKPRWMRWQSYSDLATEYWNLLALRDRATSLEMRAYLDEGGFPAAAAVAGSEEFREAWEAYKAHPHLPCFPLHCYAGSGRRGTSLGADREARRGTLGQIAAAAGVPFDFAREAEGHGLIRPDGGRGKRRKRYRRKLAAWLEKLYLLNQSGYSWEELAAWTRRRFQAGHEHERRFPAGFLLH